MQVTFAPSPTPSLPRPLPLSEQRVTCLPHVPSPTEHLPSVTCVNGPKVEASCCSGKPCNLKPQALVFGLFSRHPRYPLSPCRYCTEGKRTFSSRLILEKHVQVRHGLPLGAQSPGRGSTLARGPSARAQVGRSPACSFGAVGLGNCRVLGPGLRKQGKGARVSVG